MIFLTGPHNSGKSTLARRLVESGFIHTETGDLIRQKFKEQEQSGSTFLEWAKKINNENPNFFNEIILQNIIDSGCDLHLLVVTGNRQFSGVKYLIDRSQIGPNGNVIIFLDASEQEP